MPYSANLRLNRKKAFMQQADAELEHFKVKKTEFFEVHQNSGLAGDLVANIALSFAVEVGMDFDNAYDAILFKAIRNISFTARRLAAWVVNDFVMFMPPC